jgi:hypothetical protein
MPVLPVVHVPDCGLLLPLSNPLRLDDDAVVEVTVTYKTLPDELGLRRMVTDKVLMIDGRRALSFMHVRESARGAVVLQDTKMPMRNGKLQLPPSMPVGGLLVFGPCR